MISVLNSVSQLGAENALASTQASLQKTLSAAVDRTEDQLRIRRRSRTFNRLWFGRQHLRSHTVQPNASNGVGFAQTADGALSQVTSLLNRAVTLATEAANGGLTTAQSTAADTEYQSILTEIGNIGSQTNFNGTAVFSATAMKVFTSDGTAAVTGARLLPTGTLAPATDLGLTGRSNIRCERKDASWPPSLLRSTPFPQLVAPSARP